MAEGQDFLNLGLDISGFDEAKKAQLQQYIQLFEQLSKYDGKVINPILGPGLADLNSSISSTNKLLSDINTQLSQFTSSTNTASAAVGRAASTSKILTDEQAKQKVQIAELNRLKIEQAKAENILVQSRINAANAVKEQFDMETQISKQRKADSALIQAMMQKEIKSEEDLAKQQERDSKTISAMRKKDAAERQALLKKEFEDEENIAIQHEKDSKKLISLKRQEQAESKRSEAQAQREQAANKLLSNSYYQLTQTLKDQAAIYSNLFVNKGANDPATKQALKDYGQTAAVIGQINTKLQSAQPRAFGLGKGLSSIYNQLRTIAYILPGIGIAGIFNLAFEAIEKASESLGLFSNKEKLTIETNAKLTQSYIDLEDEIKNLIKLFSSDLNPIEFAGIEKDNLQALKDKIELQRASNKSTRDQMVAEQDLVKQQALTANKLFFDSGGFTKLEQYSKALDKWKDTYQKALEDQRVLDEGKGGFSFDGVKLDKETVKARVDEAKRELDYVSKLYEDQKKIVEDNANLNTKLKAQELQLAEFDAEQERKLILETVRLKVEHNKNANDEIIANDKYALDAKLSAIKDNYKQQRVLLAAENNYILSRPDSRNANGELTTEAKNAINKNNQDVIELRIKTEQDTSKLIEDYRQRRLEAQKNIDKQELESSAITNERLFQNDKNGLDERLSAYVKYVSAKQKIQDIEYQRDIDVLRLKARDKNGNLDPTVQKEIEELQSNRDAQKLEAQANVEKQVYDIVSSSYDRQLKLVKEANESQNQESKKEYTKQLNDLNDAYDKRIIGYRRYKKELDKINKEYTTKGFDDDIKDDLEDIQRLTELINNEQSRLKSANNKVDTAKIGIEVANSFGGDKNQAKKKLDEAVGEQESITDAITKATNERNSKQEKLADDELKRAKSRNSKKIKQDIDWYIIAERVERQLYEAVKGFADKQYEYRVQMLEKQKELIDEQYGYEISAIEKSTLSAKDKAALEIQLQAQKREYDKKAIADENKIKVQQAEFDKKLSIAHIIISTAEAIMAFSAKANAAGAIAAGITGAVELGVAISTPIPSFEKGVKNFEGGVARYGEAGMEVVKEPGKQARLVMTETISYLPKGTDVIPVKEPPVFEEKIADNGWEQTLYLAKEIRKSKSEIKNSTTILKIDMGFEKYKKTILRNG